MGYGFIVPFFTTSDTSHKIDFTTLGVATGSINISTSGNKTVNVGFRPRLIIFISGFGTLSSAATYSYGTATANGQNVTAGATDVNNASAYRTSSTSHCYIATTGTGITARLRLLNMTDTGFVLGQDMGTSSHPAFYTALE